MFKKVLKYQPDPSPKILHSQSSHLAKIYSLMGLNRYKARVSGRVMWEEFVWPPADWPQAGERLGWAWAPWIFIYQVWYNQKMVNCFSALLHTHHTPCLPLSFSTLLQYMQKIFHICVFSHWDICLYNEKVKVCYGKLGQLCNLRCSTSLHKGVEPLLALLHG